MRASLNIGIGMVTSPIPYSTANPRQFDHRLSVHTIKNPIWSIFNPFPMLGCRDKGEDLYVFEPLKRAIFNYDGFLYGGSVGYRKSNVHYREGDIITLHFHTKRRTLHIQKVNYFGQRSPYSVNITLE